jgi:hypothetical protein
MAVLMIHATAVIMGHYLGQSSQKRGAVRGEGLETCQGYRVFGDATSIALDLEFKPLALPIVKDIASGAKRLERLVSYV